MAAANYWTRSTARTRAGHSENLDSFSSSRNSFEFSIFPRTVPLWNSLPDSVAEAPSLASFLHSFLAKLHEVPSCLVIHQSGSLSIGGKRTLTSARTAVGCLSDDPKASGNTFLLSFLLVCSLKIYIESHFICYLYFCLFTFLVVVFFF